MSALGGTSARPVFPAAMTGVIQSVAAYVGHPFVDPLMDIWIIFGAPYTPPAHA